MKPEERFCNMVEKQGWKCQIIPISHLADLEGAIRNRYEQGLIDEKFYQSQLNSFSFDDPPDFPTACSIIIVAVPTPQIRIFFNWQEEKVPVIIPPTYVSYTSRAGNVESIFADWLKQEGHCVKRARLPLKTLAAFSGLASYGRNNICYVPGMGSFFQLVSVFSDLPCESDAWKDSSALNRCNSCVACLRKCPTGAISKDRFLLHAERCLTYHNESLFDFPDWIDSSWHHCLIGCLRCQTICPENKAVKNQYEDRVEFTEQETSLLMQGVSLDQLPADTACKLQSLEINEDYRVLCRNLSEIIKGKAKTLIKNHL